MTTANRNALFSERFGNFEMVARQGSPMGSPTGPRWQSFTKFWALTGDRVLFLATIRGPGVTAANDRVLALAGEDGVTQILLREGDPAPGCGQAKIGTILDVVAEPLGNRYAVIASLIGASSATNQALFVGRASLLVTRKTLRRPWLAVRKGDLLRSSGGGTSTVKSVTWTKGTADATGAGAKGLGAPINSTGTLAVLVTMADGSVQAALLER